ncbi:hypothetical protein AGLY_013286 [Aphis glycines]|uniref:Uncharacterized protein n=1 Tax=Aphis glycines TaxID=307491 RepID=A0A6G0T5V6_APHGL|nr:hypothetical protein AGLY_013286 [Aphis glycines]
MGPRNCRRILYIETPLWRCCTIGVKRPTRRRHHRSRLRFGTSSVLGRSSLFWSVPYAPVSNSHPSDSYSINRETTRDFPYRSSSVFILPFVRSIARWFFFHSAHCTSYRERVSELTERRPDRQPANTTVPVYIHTEETTLRHRCLLRLIISFLWNTRPLTRLPLLLLLYTTTYSSVRYHNRHHDGALLSPLRPLSSTPL